MVDNGSAIRILLIGVLCSPKFKLDNARVVLYNCIVTQMSKRIEAKSKRSACCRSVGKLFEARFFKALCDPGRINLLVKLAQSCGPRTVSDIAGCCPTDLSVVSRHLAILRDAGILEARKNGKEVYYSVRYSELTATLRTMADAIEACCPND